MIFKIINMQNKIYGDFVLDEDELFQEASIALYNACIKYEELKGMKFSSYAYLCIRSKILNCIRDFAIQVNKIMYSLDRNPYQYFYHENLICNQPLEYHIEQTKKEELDRFISTLPDLEKRILTLRLQNKTYKEIAQELSISRKKVDNKLTRLKKKMKELNTN